MSIATTSYSSANVARRVAIAELLPLISNGDPMAWEEILRRYSSLVTAIVGSFRLQHADALDAIQTTWLRLTENTHRIRNPDRLSGWLATTARRACLNILQQASRTSGPSHTLDLADPSRDPERQVIDADTARALWTLVEELSPRQQILLRALFTDHPRPYLEIARITGIPSGAIGPTRARALTQLRGRLNQRQFIARAAARSTRPAKRSTGT